MSNQIIVYMEKKEINYKVTLEHDDFVLLLDVLRKAQESRLINWDGAGFICQHTLNTARYGTN